MVKWSKINSLFSKRKILLIMIIIFICFLSIILFIFSNNHKTNKILEPSSNNNYTRYNYYDKLGKINFKLKDYPITASINVNIILAYSENDKDTLLKLENCHSEIINYLNYYFSEKYAEEFTYKNAVNVDEIFRSEVKEQLNILLFNEEKIKLVLFDLFDVIDENGLIYIKLY